MLRSSLVATAHCRIYVLRCSSIRSPDWRIVERWRPTSLIGGRRAIPCWRRISISMDLKRSTIALVTTQAMKS